MAKTSDIQKDLGALKDDVEKLRKHTVDLVSQVTDAGKSSVGSAVDSSKKRVMDAAKKIEKNPVATLAGAVGLGVVLGGVVKRLLRKKR